MGKQLIADAKSDVLSNEKTGSGLEGRDLLTLLVKANMGESPTRRLSDDDVLARKYEYHLPGIYSHYLESLS